MPARPRKLAPLQLLLEAMKRPVNRRVLSIQHDLPLTRAHKLANVAREILARSSRPEYPVSVHVFHGTPRKYKGLPDPTIPQEGGTFVTPVKRAAMSYRDDHHWLDSRPGQGKLFNLMLMGKEVHVPKGIVGGHGKPGIINAFMHGRGNRAKVDYPSYIANAEDMLVPVKSPEGRLRRVIQRLQDDVAKDLDLAEIQTLNDRNDPGGYWRSLFRGSRSRSKVPFHPDSEWTSVEFPDGRSQTPELTHHSRALAAKMIGEGIELSSVAKRKADLRLAKIKESNARAAEWSSRYQSSHVFGQESARPDSPSAIAVERRRKFPPKDIELKRKRLRMSRGGGQLKLPLGSPLAELLDHLRKYPAIDPNVRLGEQQLKTLGEIAPGRILSYLAASLRKAIETDIPF